MTAKSNPEVIIVKGEVQYGEGLSAVAVTPGAVLEYADATTGSVRPTSAVSTAPQTLKVALSDTDTGQAWNADWLANSSVKYATPQRGSVVNLLLANGDQTTAGALVQVAAGGTVENRAGSNNAVGVALETKNNTSGSTQRIQVEVL